MPGRKILVVPGGAVERGWEKRFAAPERTEGTSIRDSVVGSRRKEKFLKTGRRLTPKRERRSSAKTDYGGRERFAFLSV